MTVTQRDQRRTSLRWFLLTGGIVFIAWSAAVAWLAVPRHDLCHAVLPVPAGCVLADRVPVALVLAGLMVALLAGSAAAVRRWGQARWLVWGATGTYVVIALVTYRVVLYS